MKHMIPVLLSLLLLVGCGEGEETASYRQISPEEAKEMMDTQEVIILDVREQDEYDRGHSLRHPGGTGLHQYLRIRRNQDLAL